MKLFLFIILISGAQFFISCKKESTANDGNTNCSVSFSLAVSAIVQTNCAFSSGCHAAGSTNSGGSFTNYSLIAAKKSIIKAQVEAGIMPQGASLTANEKAALINWINCGAPNN